MKNHKHQPSYTSAARPSVGWPELIVGIAGFFAVGWALFGLFSLFDAEPVIVGVLQSLLAGLATLGAFGLAFSLRVRRLVAFGFTRTTPKWLIVGALGGAAVFLLRGILLPPLIDLFGLATDTQSQLVGGAQGGLLALVVTGIGIAIIGPVGEEMLFRGVVQTALFRYGAVISTLGSAIVFALIHGSISVLTPLAFLVGVLTAELYRRSGSLWPAIVAHIVHNAPTIFLYTLL
ncbi:CPBP family intramembrane glutamic endopeptidase [Sediminivirga luteola]|nr:type II CAAX endopeptidase family protein [Sediminivirga luteola]